MGRILDKDLYPVDGNLSLDDYVIGSDADSVGKDTRNYELKGILSTFQSALDLASISYVFSDEIVDPQLTEEDAGYFTANNTLAPAITQININKTEDNGQDITGLIEVIALQPTSFVLKLYKPSVVGQVFYFALSSIVDNGTFYTLNVSNFLGSNSFVDATTYSFVFDVSGVPSIYTETDPIFSASPAAGIDNNDIMNWDAAFAWGDHALEGYLKAPDVADFIRLTDLSVTTNPAGSAALSYDSVTGVFTYTPPDLSGFITSETDPVFTASPAFGITNVLINQWNTAFSWGDHAVEGYITAEVDPVFIASPAGGITAIQIQNWDAAYSWGDHGVVGYLLPTDIDTLAKLNAIVADATITQTGDNVSVFTNDVGYVTSNIYTANGSLTGPRTLDLNGNELLFDNAGTSIYFNNGRIGAGDINPWFSGSQITNDPNYAIQTPGVATYGVVLKQFGDTQSDGNGPVAMFATLVSGGLSDGYVTSIKNFKDDVQVISISGVGAADITDSNREVETTFGLRNDYTAGQFSVFDTFNNDYPTGTAPEVRQSMGWVAIHGGGAPAKEIGLWRYDTTTYTPIFEVSPSNVWNFGNIDVNINGNAIIDQGDLPLNITTAAKGDILVFDGTNWVDLTVGANTQVLTANSATATGLEWAAAAGGGGATTLAALTDTTISSPGAFDFLRHDGTDWKNVTIDNLGAGEAGQSYDIVDLDTAKTVGQSVFFQNTAAGSTNTPDSTDGYAFTLAQGDVANRGAQIAVGRATDTMWYRVFDNGVWRRLANASINETFDGTLTVNGNIVEVAGVSPRYYLNETGGANGIWSILADGGTLDIRNETVSDTILRLADTEITLFENTTIQGSSDTADATVRDFNFNNLSNTNGDKRMAILRARNDNGASGTRGGYFQFIVRRPDTALTFDFPLDIHHNIVEIKKQASIAGTLDMSANPIIDVDYVDFSAPSTANANNWDTEDFTATAHSFWMTSNTTSSTNFPTSFGQTAWFKGASDARSWAFWNSSAADSPNQFYLGQLTASSTWNWYKILNEGTDVATITPSAGANVSWTWAGTGDVTLILDADTNDSGENDNPQIRMRQDGGAVVFEMGLTGNAGTFLTGSGANNAYFKLDDSSHDFHWGNGTTGVEMTLDNGTGDLTANDFVLSSDRRLKKNIKDIKVKDGAVRWRTFKLKNSDKDELKAGVIAQELEEIYPEYVRTKSDGHLSVAYTSLFAAELAKKDKQIEDLQGQIDELRGLIETIVPSLN